MLVLLVICWLLLTGCSSLQGTGTKGYISGDGTIVTYDPADRGEPVELTGTSLDGRPLDVADSRGRVLVVNVWWSGCAPCRREMPMLVEAAGRLRSEADFLGINIRDSSAQQGRAFAESFAVPYPSIYDPTGRALLAFSGSIAPRTIPTTVVLDPQGRVAASVAGEVPSTLTLVELVREVGTADG